MSLEHKKKRPIDELEPLPQRTNTAPIVDRSDLEVMITEVGVVAANRIAPKPTIDAIDRFLSLVLVMFED